MIVLFMIADELQSHKLTIIAEHLVLHDMDYICVFQLLLWQVACVASLVAVL